MADESVQVALRVRPQSARERIDLCRVCTSCSLDTTQVVLGKDKAFTYDHVYDMDTQQQSLYTTCVENLVERCFEGYNATIMAYGQTGAGKTFTMGTGFDVDVADADIGVVPRAVEHIFSGIERRQLDAKDANHPVPQFQLEAEFMELYNEEIFDLFDANSSSKKSLRIHEDAGRIFVAGISTRAVTSAEQTMSTLKEGALSRTTASTSMNAQSSRSHAIFTLHITQQRIITGAAKSESSEDTADSPASTSTDASNGTGGDNAAVDFETLSAKLHFVDLAGSERLKRTGATGDRAKEGISINCGLLALGNVISALGDKSKRASHVPYRDNKLTRLLQDSLGGNSQTLMIACISPSDRDFMETLNTLKYANRARNIKNKVVVNQDKASQQISALRAEIQRLSTELDEFKTGRRSVTADGDMVVSDHVFEISMLRAENDKMKLRVRALQDTVEQQATRLAQQQIRLDLPGSSGSGADLDEDVAKLVQRYLMEIESLKGQLLESESLAKVGPPMSPFRRASPCVSRTQSRTHGTLAPSSLMTSSVPENLLMEAHSDLARMKEQQDKLSSSTSRSSTSGPSKKTKESADTTAEGESSDDDNADDEEPAPTSDTEAASDASGSDSDSSSAEDPDVQSLESDLAELSSEISIKQRLIDQLQATQQQLQSMRKHYEEQLLVLQTKIKETESERDQVLSNMENRGAATEEQVKKVKGDFNNKLKNLQGELSKMKTAKKEHQQLLKAKSRNEEKLRQLQNDLQDMKKHRVKMMREMREESAKNREREAKRAREVQQLKKESRKHESHIKSLEAERQRRENVLRRKNEEVAMLRKQKQASAPAASLTRTTSGSMMSTRSSSSYSQANLSASAALGPAQRSLSQPSGIAGAGGPATAAKRSRKPSSVFSTTGGKKKWQRLERMVHDAISQRQTLGSMEQDMDRLFAERDRLGQEVKDCTHKREDALLNMQDDTSIRDMDEQLEALEAHLEFVQSNIDERQDEIMQLMEAKDEGDTVKATGLLQSCSMKEARYLLDHFLQLAIAMGAQASQHETESKQLRGRLTQSEQQDKVREQLLLHMVGDESEVLQQQPRESSPTGVGAASGTNSPLTTSPIKSRPRSMTSPNPDENRPPSRDLDSTFVVPSPELLKELGTASTTSTGREVKSRRRTFLPNEVHQPGISASSPTADQSDDDMASPMTSLSANATFSVLPSSSLEPSQSSSLPRRLRQATNSLSSLSVTPTTSDTILSTKDDNVIKRPRSYTDEQRTLKSLGVSPQLARKKSDSLSSSTSDLTSSLPSKLVRNSEDVFKRLTNDTSSQPEVVHSSKTGTISATSSRRSDKGRSDKGQVLTCTHTVEGHVRSVLAVSSSSSALFTGSQDRTAKIWDLQAGKEVVSLGGHASSVVSVRYGDRSGLVFTACQSTVKVWDVRDGQMKCVKVLGGASGSSASEAVHDMCLSRDESVLYATCGSAVRVWDLNKFQSLGRLVGFSAPVAALLLLPSHHLSPEPSCGSTFLATGARDHYVKIFEVNPKLANIQTACHQLEPPHYDGVQSLFQNDGKLYSGSRDHSIKQWDLATKQPKQSVNGAHNAWVSSILKVQSSSAGGQSGLLASACRSGVVKLWQLGTCAPHGEVTAHKQPINAMAANDGQLFTASTDRTVKVWKYQEQS